MIKCGVDKVIPVNFYVSGCPPRPEAILYGVAVALGLAPKKEAKEILRDFPEATDIDVPMLELQKLDCG